MSRRIQPPDYPTTGHPYVDNALRNAWREYRDHLQRCDPCQRYIETHYAPGEFPENIFFDTPDFIEEPRIPRKLKKGFANNILSAAFIYFEPDYYTPKRALL